MKAIAVSPDPRLVALLPGSTFADAFSVTGLPATVTAPQAARQIFGNLPGWAVALMALRNALARLVGLKTEAHVEDLGPLGRIGLFPVLTESPREVLMGLADRHLDFRIAVTVEHGSDGASRLTVTTVVRTHNRLGRIYMILILPFHRLIARASLQRGAKALQALS